MTDDVSNGPVFSVDECNSCHGTRYDQKSGFRIMGCVFRQRLCTVCGGEGAIEYVRIKSGLLVRAENWRNSPEGQFSLAYLTGHQEYPTWDTIRKALFSSPDESETGLQSDCPTEGYGGITDGQILHPPPGVTFH